MSYFIKIGDGERTLAINLDAISYVSQGAAGEETLLIHFDKDHTCQLHGEAAANLLAAIDRHQRTVYGHVESPQQTLTGKVL